MNELNQGITNTKVLDFARSKMIMEKADKMSPKKQTKTYDDAYDYGSQIEQSVLNSYNPQSFQAPVNTGGLKPSASKLPKEVLESFMSNPIQNDNMSGVSVLDNIQYNAPKKQLVENNYQFDDEKELPTTEELIKQRTLKMKQGLINEQATPIVKNIGSSIDYELLKMIIESCIDKKINELKKSILTENTNNRVKDDVILTVGDRIKFVSKNGNLYEGVVKKVGNIND